MSGHFFQSGLDRFAYDLTAGVSVSGVLFCAGNFYDHLAISVVPEVQTAWMMLAGMAALGVLGTRRDA